MSFLADLAKAKKKQESATAPTLIPRVDEYLMMRPEQDRRDGRFHPSDLSYKFCPRAWALYNYHPQGLNTKKAGFKPRTYRIFDNGTGFHERTQRYFHMLGLLWGRWRRPARFEEGVVVYETHVGFAPRLRDGSVDPTWEYNEVKLRNDRRNVLGSTDGIMPLKGTSRLGFEYGKWGLELKSINSNGFGWVREGPRDYHEGQTFIYADALEEERGLPDSESMWYGAEGYDFWMQPLEGFIVLYEDKDKQELREFVVPFSQEKIDSFFNELAPAMNEALAYKRAHEEGRQIHYPFCRCPDKPELLCKTFNIG